MEQANYENKSNDRCETKVVFDEEERVIKVESPYLKPVATFGTSFLYQWGQYNFHPRAIEILSKVDRLKFHQDDVLLTMFPKSGSTWLSECIYLIVRRYEYGLAAKDSIEYRFPQIDSPSHDVFDLIIEQYSKVSSSQLIKSSVPPNLLIDTGLQESVVRPRVVSIFRNPRDVLVSFYHHCKTVKHYDIEFDFNEFYETFVSGRVPCGPIWLMYNDMYRYYITNPKSSLVIFYEDMKQDLCSQIRKICHFLNKPEPANAHEWTLLVDHLSVDKMRQNRTINRHDWDQLGLRNPNGFEFVRKGQVNDWKNFFSEQQSLRFDREITDKLLPDLKQRYGPQIYSA